MPSNIIKKHSIETLGYNFIKPQYIPSGSNEFYLRNLQNRNGINYRQLTAYEIELLVRNRNTSDNWNNILVSDAFNADLVKNCKFFGLVRIGKLEPFSLEFSDLIVPVGLYNSTIISCDFGDNVVVDNVNYLSHYIIGSEVIIVNVNELVTTDYAKFGNGILKVDEEENTRIWLELCNENGGRKIIPFNGMLPGDAYMWTKYRDDEALLKKLQEFTEKDFDNKRGYYGKIGNRTVIKNCNIIKDVWIGEDAYLKGANKLKNLTINSGKEGKSQIGEGCEMVNGIMGFGCRAFYGVKAVRFIMASHSQLKYGARLINSYLGNNSTISCCEVLNSLIFPAHEQHHNNSFLCASLIMGQSNIAAGATIGSNHNSRSADGEIVAGRGFWPGLCVSLKHNSKFAAYTMLSKGDYPAELHIPIPFSLVSNDVTNNQLVIMPAYWFMYNMYALQRNCNKYMDRDKRTDKAQHIEYDFLAPDSINEVFTALELLKKFTGKAWQTKEHGDKKFTDEEMILAGFKLLEESDLAVSSLQITADGFENTKRQVVLIKVLEAYRIFKDLVFYYGATQVINYLSDTASQGLTGLRNLIPARLSRSNWINFGGQLMPASDVDELKKKIKSGKIASWTAVHGFYKVQEEKYRHQILMHALASLQELSGFKLKKATANDWAGYFNDVIRIKEWMVKGIYKSREKDYTNPFRKMVFENLEEMNAVTGSFADNTFIREQKEELKKLKKTVASLIASLQNGA